MERIGGTEEEKREREENGSGRRRATRRSSEAGCAACTSRSSSRRARATTRQRSMVRARPNVPALLVSDADLVVAETQKTFGVQKIVKVFDYLPEEYADPALD